MSNSKSNEYLESLAIIHEKIAEILFISAPVADWTTISLLVQANPAGDTYSIRYKYKLIDGLEPVHLRPKGGADIDIIDLVSDELQLTRNAKQCWFRMEVRVEQKGKFSINFLYRDTYEVGDIDKWD
jgi:hypothetical protein